MFEIQAVSVSILTIYVNFIDIVFLIEQYIARPLCKTSQCLKIHQTITREKRYVRSTPIEASSTAAATPFTLCDGSESATTELLLCEDTWLQVSQQLHRVSDPRLVLRKCKPLDEERYQTDISERSSLIGWCPYDKRL